MVRKVRAARADAAGIAEGKLSRRALLAGGAGLSLLVAVPGLLVSTAAQAHAPGTAAGPDGRFFLYGTTEQGVDAALHGWSSSVARGALSASATAPTTVATELAAQPVKSADGSTLAVPTVSMDAAGAAVTITLVDTGPGAGQSTATIRLAGVPADALVLVRPVFTPSAQSVAVVLAVSVPTYGGMFSKVVDARTSIEVRATSWTTHHQLAYLDRASLTFTGPFDLANAPSLAWTDAVADDSHLYLWTMREPAASGSTKTNLLPVSPPRLLAFPLGSAEPATSLRSPGAWPGGQIGMVLGTSEVARLVEGRRLEVYSPSTGRHAVMPIAELDAPMAKPGVTNVHQRPDGTLVVANAQLGRAAVVDPAAAFATTKVINFPPPAIPLGGSDAKTALSPDGATLYTLGAANTGGLRAYDIATAKLVSTFSDGAHYSSVHRLDGGSLLAVNGQDSKPQLTFFSQGLDSLGSSSISMYVADVY